MRYIIMHASLFLREHRMPKIKAKITCHLSQNISVPIYVVILVDADYLPLGIIQIADDFNNFEGIVLPV